MRLKSEIEISLSQADLLVRITPVSHFFLYYVVSHLAQKLPRYSIVLFIYSYELCF